MAFFFLTLFLLKPLFADSYIDSISENLNCQKMAAYDYCEIASIKANDKILYSQAIGIFIPKNLEKVENAFLYFHGFRPDSGNICEAKQKDGPRGINEQANILGQLQQTAYKNAILIIPISIGKCETYHFDFVKRSTQILEQLSQVLKLGDISWGVGGHSGGGAVISELLNSNKEFSKRVRKVVYLDATYRGNIGYWENIFPGAGSKIKFRSVYIPNSPTQPESLRFASKFQGYDIVIKASSGTDHCHIPKKYLGLMLGEDF